MFALRNAVLAVALMGAPLALAEDSFEPTTMSEAQRDAFNAAVHSYIVNNPEVLIEAMQVLEMRQAEAEARADEELVAQYLDELQDDGISWVGGNPDGDITVVEFLDYRCHFCRKAHPHVTDLIAGDGNIRLVVKEYPILGDDSEASSRAAIAALQAFGPEAYVSMSEALIGFGGTVNARSVRVIAKRAGLDGDVIADAMGSDAVSDHIGQVRALGQALKVSGTPTFVIGDQVVRGFIELAQMQAIVDEQRAAN